MLTCPTFFIRGAINKIGAISNRCPLCALFATTTVQVVVFPNYSSRAWLGFPFTVEYADNPHIIGRQLLVMAACTIQLGHGLLLVRNAGDGPLHIVGGQLGVFAMTVQAPSHRQRRVLFHSIHALNGSMALLAPYTGEHVLAVIEIDKVGQIVDLHPPDWTLLSDRLLQLFDLSGLLLKQVVAIHADAGRRNTCVAAGACAKMAVQARNLVLPGMQSMRKGNGLFWLVALLNSHLRKFPGDTSARDAQAEDAKEDKLGTHR
jgi:hypothetical protein